MTGQQRQKELYKHGFPAGEIKFIYGYFFLTIVYHFIPGFTISMFSLRVWLYFAMFTMCFPFFGYLNY